MATVEQRIGKLSSGYPRLLGPAAATAIQTDGAGLVAGEVGIPVADGLLPAYRAQPAGPGPHPILLVVQEVFGVDEYLQDTCRRAAREGFLAIAPELYARQGDVGKARSREELFALVGSVSDAQVLGDLDACASWAAKGAGGDPARVCVTGFCWGGRIVWLYAAHSPTLRAGVAWYGRLVGETDPRHPKYPIDVAQSLRAPVLGLYGAEDQGIPLATVEQMKERLQAAGDPSRFIVYPGAPHAFHADYRPSFQAKAASDGWARLLDWLDEHGARS